MVYQKGMYSIFLLVKLIRKGNVSVHWTGPTDDVLTDFQAWVIKVSLTDNFIAISNTNL